MKTKELLWKPIVHAQGTTHPVPVDSEDWPASPPIPTYTQMSVSREKLGMEKEKCRFGAIHTD